MTKRDERIAECAAINLASARMISAEDIREFSAYLHNCTDAQVRGVYDKEKKAGRDAYAALAEVEGERRGLIFLD